MFESSLPDITKTPFYWAVSGCIFEWATRNFCRQAITRGAKVGEFGRAAQPGEERVRVHHGIGAVVPFNRFGKQCERLGVLAAIGEVRGSQVVRFGIRRDRCLRRHGRDVARRLVLGASDQHVVTGPLKNMRRAESYGFFCLTVAQQCH